MTDSTEELVEARLYDAGLNPDNFDVEAMVCDFDNSNLNLDTDDLFEYECHTIVATSIYNGQFTQAKKQAASYHLEYDRVYHSVKGKFPD